MELTQLRYFIEAARLEHMTKAAERLHIAQPALTQAIHRLEQELGVQLFFRKGRGIALTSCGKTFLKKATELIGHADKIIGEMQVASENEHRTVRINVQAASYIVTEAVIKYKQEAEQVHFQLRHEDELSDITVNTQIHRERKSSDNEYVFTERILLAVPGNSKYKGDTIRLENVKTEGFVALAGSWQFGAMCDKLCALAGFEPNIVFRSDNPIAVKNIIAAGAGIGFWPEYAWGELDSNDVRLLSIEDVDFRRDIIVSRNMDADNQYILHFYNFISKYMDNLKKRS